MALAPTLTVCDLLIMIMGQLASFGLPLWRRAGRQNRSGVTPMESAIGTSACVRPSWRSSVSPAGLAVKGPRSAPFWGFLAAVLCVAARRGQPRSSSLRCGRSKLTTAVRDGEGWAAIEESPAGVRPSGRGRSWTGPEPSRRRSCWRGAPWRSRSPRPSCRGPAAAGRSVGRPGRHATARSRGRSAHAAKPRCLSS